MKFKPDSTVSSIARSILITLNPLFAVAAFTIIILGILVMINVDNLVAFYPEGTNMAAVILIVAGCAVLAASILGFVGSWFKKPKFLMAYMVLMFVAAWIQVAGGITAYVKGNNFKGELLAKMIELRYLHNTPPPGSAEAQEAWAVLQSEYFCCGVDFYTEWNGRAPKSCTCTIGQRNCEKVPENLFLFTAGCYSQLQHYSDFNYVSAGIAVTFFLFEILCVICAYVTHQVLKQDTSDGKKISD